MTPARGHARAARAAGLLAVATAAASGTLGCPSSSARGRPGGEVASATASAGPPPSPGAPSEESAVEAAASPASSARTGASAPNSSGAGTAAASPSGAGTAAASPSGLPSGARLGAGLKVLHVGDSMAGALGVELGRLLRADGLESRLVSRTASSIGQWASTPELASHVAQFAPDLVIVSLGANESRVLDPTLRRGPIRRLVAAVGARACLWVLPPIGREGRPRLFDVVAEAAAPCATVETDALIAGLPRERDGIHPLFGARPTFARVLRRWLEVERDAARAGFGFRTPLEPWSTVAFDSLPDWARAD